MWRGSLCPGNIDRHCPVMQAGAVEERGRAMSKNSIRNEVRRKLAEAEPNEAGVRIVNSGLLASTLLRLYPNVFEKDDLLDHIHDECRKQDVVFIG